MNTHSHRSRRASGVTLIELAFVIGIIAIIVIAALAIFNAVRASQDRSTALQQVSAIRAAIATWAGDGPANIGIAPTSDQRYAPLQFGAELEPWLPGRLATAANLATSDLTFDNANPWNGNYVLQAAQPPGPYLFALVIESVPGAEAAALCRQLLAGAATGSGGTTTVKRE